MAMKEQRRGSLARQSPYGALTFDHAWGLAPQIDQVMLGALSAHDPALACELLTLFIEQSGVILMRLRQAEGGESRRDLAHRLHGTALAIAAPRLAEAAQTLATFPDETDETQWQVGLARLIAEGERTRAVIAAFLARNADV